MNDIAIRVENLSKRYRIGVERHDTLRDALAGFGRKKPQSAIQNPKSEEFWALRDVSFEVKRGEVVGVIGRNGAGKSTLLKILSRITEPTGGLAEIHGRVGSLLEVGTGFHPELTGRENIYLNGAILGMKRTEIALKFDEIVAFSEIEKFLDTPVKRYSSGMYVRLAFAVAAHLEPEILLVDEVLAVGDAAFQKKCLGKMGEVAGEGRTVLFVSHNMGAIGQLCPQCLLVEQGSIVFHGASRHAIACYLRKSNEIRGAMWGGIESVDSDVEIISVDCDPLPVYIGDPFTITIKYHTTQIARKGLRFGISIENSLGERITGSYTGREGLQIEIVEGDHSARLTFPVLPLIPGDYYVTVAIHNDIDENMIRLEQAASFRIIARDLTGSGHLVDRRNGLVWLEHTWSLL